MNVLVTGSSGMVGSALAASLAGGGHRVVRLVRPGSAGEAAPAPPPSRQPGLEGEPPPSRQHGSAGEPPPAVARWNPSAGTIDTAGLGGLDAAVHLAGEPIAAGRWTARKKERIRNSRTGGTRLLSQALGALDRPPSVLVCASAVGYYGNRGDEVLTEESPAGGGFLAEVCRAWEHAADPAARCGIRVVHLRFGMVLSRRGGALARMLPVFRLGVGGRIGSGRQYLSWIALDDAVRVVERALADPSLRGPINAVSPRPVTNRELTAALGHALGRPAVIPVPAAAARLALGEVADELLLASARAVPARLTDAGFEFRFPDLEPALRHALAGPRASG